MNCSASSNSNLPSASTSATTVSMPMTACDWEAMGCEKRCLTIVSGEGRKKVRFLRGGAEVWKLGANAQPPGVLQTPGGCVKVRDGSGEHLRGAGEAARQLVFFLGAVL